MPQDAVECRSEFVYAQQPVALTWQGRRLAVAAILAQARTPTGRRFHVRAGQSQGFRLDYHEADDEWQIHLL